ncbi:unnamed protein product [Adineta steineri]|uniref:ATP-grasp domain-containing protein n=1 Tax=Adineta steineri TaxID=433720 RepID=A0A815UQG2_9BILA|nr:unnamed protein product [Adineta steineri]CAF1650198.1 unnamed protein product [Adineta steineri]
MTVQNVSASTLVVLMDSYESSRTLRDITDSVFNHIDFICFKKDSERVALLKEKDGIICSVDSIEYEQYVACLNTIKNIRGSISAIALSSRKETLVKIAARLRANFNIPIGTRDSVATLFVDKYEMKKRAIEVDIRTSAMVQATVEEAILLIEKTSLPIVLKLRNETGSKGVHILRSNEDLKIIEQLDPQDYLIEQFIDGETYRVDGIVQNQQVQFFVVFHDYPSCFDFFNSRINLAELLVSDPKTRFEVEAISNSVVKEFGYSNGIFHLELLKNKKDGKFYFLEIAARPGGGVARKLMVKFGVDLMIQMIRIDSGLNPEIVMLPEAVYMGGVWVPTPDRNRTFVFDSINLPGKHKYKTLTEIEAPPAGKIMQEYDTISAYFSSNNEALVKQEVTQCQQMLKATYRSTAVSNKSVVDLRSDTLTLQNDGMKNAMMSVSVGDAAYGEDDTVNQLEDYCASFFGKEAALLISTGTMANQIAIRAHTKPGDEVVTDASYHINYYESAQTAAIGGVTLNLTHANRGLITVNDIQNAIGSKPRGSMYAKPTLIFLENTVNVSGGAVLSMDELRAIKAYADLHSLIVHIDGARLLNACIASNSRPHEVAAYADSVGMCFTKGLGAPFGAVLAGSRDFIEKIKVYRKWFGGTLHQVGYMAASALYSLDENWEAIFKRDHEHAKLIEAELLKVVPCKQVSKVETNIVIVDLNGIADDKSLILDAMKQQGVLALPWNGNTIRFVTSRNISRDEAVAAAAIIRNVFLNFTSNH